MKITNSKINNFLLNIQKYKIVILYGSEINKINILKKKIIQHLPENIVQNLDVKNINNDQDLLYNALFAINLFQRDLWRIIIIDHIPENLLDYSGWSMVNNIILIIDLGNLKKKNSLFFKLENLDYCATIGCYSESNNYNYLITALKHNNLHTASKEVFHMLQKKLIFDECIINNEIEKLKVAINPSQTINIQDVEQLVPDYKNNNLYQMLYYFNIGDFYSLETVLKNLYYSNYNLISLIYILYDFCEKIFWLKIAKNQQEKSSYIKKYNIHFQVLNLHENNQWSFENIGYIQSKLLELEIYLKKHNNLDYFLLGVKNILANLKI